MKIDSNSSGLDQAALQRLEKPAADALKPAAAGKTVSGDAELANEAVKAANDLPEIRTTWSSACVSCWRPGSSGTTRGSWPTA